MSKGIEAFRKIFYENDIKDKKDLEENLSIIEQALLELKAIKEANPSEALKCLEELEKVIEEITINNADLRNTLKTSVLIASIKQALLKSQEQEKKIDKLENQCLDVLADNIKLKNKAQEQEKVLKILFEKKVELMALFLSSSVEQYNNQFIRDENKLTQEEFDLLKGYFK